MLEKDSMDKMKLRH